MTLFELLLALATIVLAIRFCGAVARRLGQPPVVGELIGGILLGPSLFGRLAPELSAALLPSSTRPLLSLIGSLGVVMYMFLVGMELDLRDLRRLGRTTFVISQAGIFVPFLLGFWIGSWLHPDYAPAGVPAFVFSRFVGLSLSITAFPVLARILSDRGMTKTPIGTMALSSAAVEDAMAWCLLAVVVGVAQSAARNAIVTTLLTMAFVAFVFVVARPVARWVLERFDRDEPSPTSVLSVVLTALLASAAATEFIGVHAVFGAFLFGAVVPGHLQLASDLRHRLESVVFALFLPVFFATIGMRIDLLAMSSLSSWLVLAVIVLAACAGKLGGTLAAARLMGLGWRESTELGVLMNTRGLVELIVLDIGLSLGILSFELFTMLVITALVTTFMTSPLLDALERTR